VLYLLDYGMGKEGGDWDEIYKTRKKIKKIKIRDR
jgi:hypothetical protein